MRPWISALQTLPRQSTLYSRPTTAQRLSHFTTPRHVPIRTFCSTRYLRKDVTNGPKVDGPQADSYDNSNARPAIDLDHNITQEEKDHYAHKLREDKSKQIRTPWMREGTDKPPVARQREASAMTKGKLLTTPSRMLKLILPLTTEDVNSDRKDVEPLALLVHPQQPLSYLERLIQAELPLLSTKDGKERIPNVYFRAEDSVQEEIEPSEPDKTPESTKEGAEAAEEGAEEGGELEASDEFNFDGKTEKTGKLSGGPRPPQNRITAEKGAELRGGHGEGGVEYYSGHGHEAPGADKPKDRRFVRWSSSTEIGDFIRDAARGKEFAVEIEGAPKDIRVGVPSFNDRTYYLRMRLRKASTKIADMAKLKKECDELAHKGAQRVAMGGFSILCGYWYLVYRLTFETDLGWDTMEPVTYLVGLSTLIAGYVWFLYHNREVSYRSAMNFTISRRQSKLYAQRGFDLHKWEMLVDEGNALRKEIKAVANEYDVEWDELEDEKHEQVAEALKEQREKKNGDTKDKDGEDGDKGGPVRPSPSKK